jgi:hypothetical protein
VLYLAVRYRARIKSHGREVTARVFERKADAVAWEQDQRRLRLWVAGLQAGDRVSVPGPGLRLPRQRRQPREPPLPASFSWEVTRWVVPLPLCGTCRLTRCRCPPCLPTNQMALTPPANPPSKSGMHHSRLPWPSLEEPWRATPLLRLLIPRTCDDR